MESLSAEQLNELGLQYQAQQQTADAEKCWLAALLKSPHLLPALGNLGNLYAATGRVAEAEQAYKSAIDLAAAPKLRADLLNNLGNLYEQSKNYPAALSCYFDAITIVPDHPNSKSMGCWLSRKICDWSAVWQTQDADTTEWLPFAVLSLFDDPVCQLAAAKAWAKAELPDVTALWQGERYSHTRLRIAYLSWDFHAHATLHLIAELFESHDRTQFELYAFDWGPDDQSAIRRRTLKAFDHYESVSGMSDEAVAKRLHALEIDIAVDLKGYTAHARPSIFAHRPCPVQVNYLGYPGTMGAACIDYVIADSFLIPSGYEQYYSEAVVRLPVCYQVNDRLRECPAEAPSRVNCGLPETGFVFASFNHNYKITPEIFAVWMRLLKQVDDSVIWLLADNPWSQANLLHSAAEHGVDATRLIFAPRASIAEHLARHAHIDLFLDTYPCNAHTTASDCLWMGIPLLTLSGKSFASRVAGSLLTHLGAPELITYSLSDYEAKALALVKYPFELKAIRKKIHRCRAESAVFDGRVFAKQLEFAYEAMIHRAHKGLPPAPITFPLQKTDRTMNKLHLGCGKNILPGWINLDCAALPGVDVVADLDQCKEKPLPFEENSIELFLMSHVLEHLHKPLEVMEELWRVAKPGAVMEIRVPHGANDDAFEDPTHVRQYFEGSFGYFGQPFHWRADYGYRGDWQVKKVKLKFRAADHKGLSAEEVMARIRSLRNQVLEMIVELEAIKPIRSADANLQVPLALELVPV